MSYDRRWLEDAGSEDSHGRTLWALGECARRDVDVSRRRWAAQLFATALPVVEEFSSPRAWAFALLGLDAYCSLAPHEARADGLRHLLAEQLLALLAANKPKRWVWFEEVLAYDNARLPQALIQTGLTTETPSYVAAGLRSLRWLTTLQTAPSGCFRPVGTESFGKRHQTPAAFDQQSIEAAATISACLAAARVDDSEEWLTEATRAFRWFLGDNDLQISLIDPVTGSCLDGLHPDRPNANMGAESVLSYLLGLSEIRSSRLGAATNQTRPASRLVRRARNGPIMQPSPQGSHLVSIPIFEPPGPASAPGSRPSRRETFQAGD